MQARILAFRGGAHTQKTNQFLVEVEGGDSKEKAAKLVGKKVIWKTPSGKEIHGKVSAPHGGKGVVRTRFNRGLPGIALGTKVELKD